MIRTMQAAVVVAPGEVRIESVPVPVPKPGEIRVRLEGCGVCGSNLAPWEGRPWFKYPMQPGELGHEGWGLVEATGGEVHSFKEGDRVALLSYRAYAQYDVAPQSAVIPLPRSMSGQPFPGEALGCAVNVFKRCDIRRSQKVAVVGVGFLGAVLVELCARAGAEVIAISRRPFALEIARAAGAKHTIPMLDHWAIIAQVKELTKDQGCERVIECVGQQWPLDLAGELTAERGRLIIAGYHQDGARQVNMQMWNWRGIDVVNAHERNPATYAEGMREAAQAVAEGRLSPQPFYTHRYSLPQLPEAFNAMKERPANFLKALITI